jgi:phage/plasmid-associated DNA primase
MNPLRDFIQDRCRQHDNAWVSVAVLRRAYEQWAEETGERYIVDGKAFSEHLRSRGCKQTQRKVLGKNARGWEGIELRTEDGETLTC